MTLTLITYFLDNIAY